MKEGFLPEGRTVTNSTKQCDACGQPMHATKIAEHKTDSYGVPITLINTAEEIGCGCNDGKVLRVPMSGKLIQAIALFRVTLPERLNGAELKFLRTTLKYSSKKFAEKVDVDAATFSRWENDVRPMSVSKERLIRLFVVLELEDEAPAIQADLKEVMGMDLRGWPVADKFVDMRFTLSRYKREDHYSDLENVA